ncbi:MAG TPA: hypothetical protein VN886_08570, partial [Acidimicrobiales bacterium]|nr:hypothetical protein [Acidimicrobiales bacterium]
MTNGSGRSATTSGTIADLQTGPGMVDDQGNAFGTAADNQGDGEQKTGPGMVDDQGNAFGTAAHDSEPTDTNELDLDVPTQVAWGASSLTDSGGDSDPDIPTDPFSEGDPDIPTDPFSDSDPDFPTDPFSDSDPDFPTDPFSDTDPGDDSDDSGP